MRVTIRILRPSDDGGPVGYTYTRDAEPIAIETGHNTFGAALTDVGARIAAEPGTIESADIIVQIKPP